MIEIPTYNQADPQWRERLLQPSRWNMGNSGCFITSVSMALHAYQIRLNPEELLDELLDYNAIDAWGQLQWFGVGKATGGAANFRRRVYTSLDPRNNGLEMRIEVALARIARLLDMGQPVVLAVDNLRDDDIADHAVVAYGYTEDDLLIKDPDGGLDIPFSKKYGPIEEGVFGYVEICGPPTMFPDQSKEQNDGKAYWKADQIARGNHVETYAREIADTLTSAS